MKDSTPMFSQEADRPASSEEIKFTNVTFVAKTEANSLYRLQFTNT